MQSAINVAGAFEVWDHASESICDVTLAFIGNIEGLISKVQEGQALIERYQLNAVVLDFHPDKWVGCTGAEELLGLQVKKSGEFCLMHTGNIATLNIPITDVIAALQGALAAGTKVYAPDLDMEDVLHSLREAGIEI